MRPRRIRRGDPPHGLTETLTMSKLQCGHAEFGVEMRKLASASAAIASLQCGHAEFGVEISACPRSSTRPRDFNAATPNSAWRSARVVTGHFSWDYVAFRERRRFLVG